MGKICEEKPAISERKLAANRENAKRSTGPKTKSGKERSRRNSLKHGMRSETDLLPNELDAKVQAAIVAWKDQLRPEGAVELTLVQQAARCSRKLEWLDTQFNAAVTQQVRDAGNRFDAGERRGALLESQSLADDPSGTLEILRTSAAGCDWLIAEWQNRLHSLSNGWSEAQTAQALRLSGLDPAEPIADQSSDRSFSESRIQLRMRRGGGVEDSGCGDSRAKVARRGDEERRRSKIQTRESRNRNARSKIRFGSVESLNSRLPFSLSSANAAFSAKMKNRFRLVLENPGGADRRAFLVFSLVLGRRRGEMLS